MSEVMNVFRRMGSDKLLSGTNEIAFMTNKTKGNAEQLIAHREYLSIEPNTVERGFAHRACTLIGATRNNVNPLRGFSLVGSVTVLLTWKPQGAMNKCQISGANELAHRAYLSIETNAVERGLAHRAFMSIETNIGECGFARRAFI